MPGPFDTILRTVAKAVEDALRNIEPPPNPNMRIDPNPKPPKPPASIQLRRWRIEVRQSGVKVASFDVETTEDATDIADALERAGYRVATSLWLREEP